MSSIVDEEWRDVAGYEGIYMVSNLGRLKSLDRTICDKNGIARNIKGKMMSLQVYCGGYLMATCKKNGAGKTKYIHRLVATAFIPNPNNLSEVNHKDGDKTNNCVENLEWCTSSQNKQHAWDNGFRHVTEKLRTASANNGREKCSKKVIMDGKFLFKSFQSAADYISGPRRGVSNVIHGFSHTCLGHTFKLFNEEEQLCLIYM